ncbi:MAG: SHOCT domain-containing protein [Candidatus Bathyarchaeota archaeon]|nr:SHOCT domain-containing protein [Candidatus Bathyarchaeota archaeon]
MTERESEKIVLILVLAVVIIIVVGAFSMMTMMGGYGWGGMMGGGMMGPGMMGWGGMGFAWIWIAIFLIVLIVGAYLVITSFKREKMAPSMQAKPIEILKERYAKGEITAEEFKKMKKELKD